MNKVMRAKLLKASLQALMTDKAQSNADLLVIIA